MKAISKRRVASTEQVSESSELRSCVKVEVAVLGCWFLWT